MKPITVRRTARDKNTKDGSRLTFIEKAFDVQNRMAEKIDRKNERARKDKLRQQKRAS